MSFVEIRVQGIHPENDEDVEKVWLVDVEFADGHHERTRVARLRGGDMRPSKAIKNYLEAGRDLPPQITISPDGLHPPVPGPGQ
jgi:hypothetical protein